MKKYKIHTLQVLFNKIQFMLFFFLNLLNDRITVFQIYFHECTFTYVTVLANTVYFVKC